MVEQVWLAQIVPIAAQVNTREDGFLITCRVQFTNFRHDLCQWAAAAFAPCNARDAKAAMAITAILHFDERTGPALRPRQTIPRDGFMVKRLDGRGRVARDD